MLRRCATAAAALLLGGVAGCDDGGGDLDAFCATARRFAVDNPAAVFERVDPADPASAATLLRDAAERLAEWSGEAPGEIDDHVDILHAAATALAEQFEALASNGGAADGSPDSATAIDAAAVESASARVLDFTLAECQVDLEPEVP